MSHLLGHKWDRWGKPFAAPSDYPGIERPKSVQERDCMRCGLRARRIIGNAVTESTA